MVHLSPEQVSGMQQTHAAVQSGFAAIAEQRQQSIESLRGLPPDWSSSELGLAEYQLRHHSACQQSQALFAKENALFVQFTDATYRVC